MILILVANCLLVSQYSVTDGWLDDGWLVDGWLMMARLTKKYR
jgi:hypothetical protein